MSKLKNRLKRLNKEASQAAVPTRRGIAAFKKCAKKIKKYRNSGVSCQRVMVKLNRDMREYANGYRKPIESG